MDKLKIEELKGIIARSKRIVFFGGAGVSTASGIPDFRSESGLYSQAKESGDNGSPAVRPDPETILSATYFALHTAEFYDFYRKYMVHPEAEPNIVHKWLYELEKEDRLRGIVTQNIDGLHKAAGNKRVYELHGSVHRNYCVDCEASYPLSKILEAGADFPDGADEAEASAPSGGDARVSEKRKKNRADGVPRCDKCGGIIKPEVVLYGEPLDKYTMIGACREISNADTMIVAGTSLAVEPAASLLEYFDGKNLIVINKEATPADDAATLLIHGDVEETVKNLRIRPDNTDSILPQ